MANAIVLEIMRKDNYDDWSVCMKNYLLAQDLWDIIEGPNSEPPNQAVAEAEFKAWMKKNATVLHVIQISCRPDVFSWIRNADSAKTAWDALAKKSFRNPITTRDVTSSEYVRVPELVKNIYQGDSNFVENFLQKHPNVINAKITPFGTTALQVAIVAGKVEIGTKLMELMSPEALAIKNVYGRTALHYAANSRMARYVVEKNENLVAIADNWRIIPVVSTSQWAQTDLTVYLLSKTPFQLLSGENIGNGSLLLQWAVMSKMLDVALKILHRCPSLATARDPFFNRSALGILSISPNLFLSGCQLGFWQRLIYSCIHVDIGPLIPRDGVDHTHIKIDQSEGDNMIIKQQGKLHGLRVNLFRFLGIKKIYDLKMTHAYSRRLLNVICEHISTLNESTQADIGVPEYFRNAVECGLVEIVKKFAKASLFVFDTTDEDDRNSIMYAIVSRQEKVFNLITDIFFGEQGFVVDKFGNTMLHLAGMLSPPSQLARISGAALQMQRELQWYKGVSFISCGLMFFVQQVENMVCPVTKFLRNQNGETPAQIFTRHHKQLVIEGEKWMKDTATSCTVVGALILTICFTSAFTVPGGIVQDKGIPLFLHEKAFMAFIISDTISLFASSTSVLMFLGILTSRYDEQDFLSSLPTKLIIGLSALFISIANMMVAFCAALIIMLEGEMEVIIPMALLASVPVTLFMFLQFPLLVKIAMSTYGPSIFKRKRNR